MDKVKFFADKEKEINNYCAAIRRDEFKLVVNNGISKIDWKKY
jgi:hypothetical protein